jgi:hypothetical protein
MKLFIGIPAYQPVYPQFFMCILDMVRSVTGFQLGVSVGDSLVGRARNHLVADFLDSPCDTLLQIDSDILFTAQHIERITSHGEGIVGGFYPRKSDGPLAWIANGFNDEPKAPDERGLVELMYIGTGFLCVKREVFEKMKEHWPADNYVGDGPAKRPEHNFFPVGVVPNRCDKTGKTNRYLSEDWYFCERALQLGLKVWGDSKVILQHVGAAVYPLVGNGKIKPNDSEISNNVSSN